MRQMTRMIALWTLTLLVAFGNCVSVDTSMNRLNVNMEMTSIVFLLKICNYTTQSSVSSFTSWWYGEFPTKLNECSLGNVRFNKTKNIVVSAYIPCKFKSAVNGKIVDNTVFEAFNETIYNYEWGYYVAKNAGFDISAYKYRLLVYPRDTPATFYGLASVGCYADGCYSWYNTDTYTPSLFLHELGHNFGLDHARTPTDEYGDDSIMGYTSNQCYNAGHRYALGWSEPKSSIKLLNSKAIVNASYTLSLREFVKVDDIFLEYVNVSNQLKSVEQSLHVSVLQSDYSTVQLCSLVNVGDGCTVKQDISITIRLSKKNAGNVMFSISQEEDNGLLGFESNQNNGETHFLYAWVLFVSALGSLLMLMQSAT